MKAAALLLSAVAVYLLAGINPAIILSRAIYQTDIREKGSGNAGFTNFKRVYGGKYAYLVLALDILKGAVISVGAGRLFLRFWSSWQLGVAYAGVFAVLGHSFPMYYGFKGGKGFLVCFTSLWFLDWRAGLTAFILLCLLLLTARYMSLASMTALLGGTVCLFLCGASGAVCMMSALSVLLVIARHHSNIDRLLHGQESRFSFSNR